MRHDSSWFDTAFADAPVMAVLRGHDPARTVELAVRAWDLGIAHVEVPVPDHTAVPSLAAAIEAGAERGRPVGAGTVTTEPQLRAAVKAGAAYTVAPGLDARIVHLAADIGVPHLPGVATPSEVQAAVALGLTWLKAFPATVLGPAWFKAMAGPFPAVRFVATGGIDAASARGYLDAGAGVVAVGAALGDPAQLPLLAALAAKEA